MRVVEIETQGHQIRYVVIDEEGRLIEPLGHYLKYLDRIGSARQTLRSYATSLRLYWEFLTQQQLDWQRIKLDDLAQFVTWLKLPSGSLKVLPAFPVKQARSNRTINHTLTVVRGFYDYQRPMEEISTNMKEKTTTYLPARARRYKSFLHHISKGSPVTKNILRQKEGKRQRPRTMTKDQIQELLDACANQRDRLLVRLLYESAARIGELLALWVEDVAVAENRIQIRDRGDLENGAEIKTIHSPRSIDVSSDLMNEIVAYVGWAHTAEVETNHVFIKLHGQRSGQPLTYEDVDAFDPERVREHRQNVKMALGSCLKTAKIMCKFVELPCFHCPAYVLTPDDLPALETYERHILERIELGKQAGNVHWREVNQKNLDERVRPAIALLKQGHIVAKTDQQERE